MRVAAVAVAVVLLASLVTLPARAFPPTGRQAMIEYLAGISGQATIAGQHNREPNADPTKWTRVAQETTGQYPGLWGGDFLFAPDDVANRQAMVDAALAQWRAGSVVTLTWHVCPPTVGTTCGWDANGILGSLTDAQWAELLTDGSPLNRAWKARLDEAVPYLRQLQNAGVPVLWRPLHEINEAWSWWGGKPGSARLFQLTYDHMVHARGLTELVWVWNVKDVGDFGSYWPGDSYVDVASLDVWVQREPSTADYQAMLDVAGGKPIALGEVGQVPSVELLRAQPRWTYFMVWAEYLKDPAYNTDGAVQRTYWDSRVLVRGEVAAPTDNLAAGRPASASSQESAALGPAAAVDGDPGTRWSSAWADPQWLYVDLGSARPVSSVTVRWEAAYARQYQIQTSTDGITWHTVHSDYAADGGTDVISFPATTARYVKLYAFQRATQWGYSVWEFEVRG